MADLSRPSRLAWSCPACDWTERSGLEILLARLRAAGLLKRQDERDPALLLTLAAAAKDRLACPACGSLGIAAQIADDADDWEQSAKPCAACGQSIPAERLELFPESELCAACQKRVDQGQTPDAHDDYCPRCGERMIVRPSRRAGVARYEMICPACRR